MERVRDHRRWIDNSIEHHYLFEWKLGDVQLSRLVYSLKGWGFSKPYEIFSEVIFNHIQVRRSGFDFFMGSFLTVPEDQRGINEKTLNLFYPSCGLKDHALMLAQKLGSRMNVFPQPLIKKKTGLKQALLKKKERQFIKIETGSWKGSEALLVDDIVTSGATVRACYKALNKPKKLIVWSLFYRKNL